MRYVVISVLFLILAVGIGRTEMTTHNPVEKVRKITIYDVSQRKDVVVDTIVKSDEEWAKELAAESFKVTRKQGTEPAFTGQYWNNHASGIYKCIACGTALFSSDTKFESGTGWPSFWQPISEKNVVYVVHNTLGMERTEVRCARCGAHLGHVFDDGPAPTHKRYCMNSAALQFVPTGK